MNSILTSSTLRWPKLLPHRDTLGVVNTSAAIAAQVLNTNLSNSAWVTQFVHVARLFPAKCATRYP
jgi:hypothetical protein